jgi:uncharacterized protein with FMN-binding domain
MIRSALLFTVVMPLVVGCSAPEEHSTADAAPVCTSTMELEWGRMVDGVYTPFHDGDTAEIVVGFQGFRFIDAIARIRGVQTKQATFTFEATLDGHEKMVQDAGSFDAKQEPDGALYVHSLQLFFNDVPMPELLGQQVTVVVNGKAAGCSASTGARVSLARGGCMNEKGEIVPCVTG